MDAYSTEIITVLETLIAPGQQVRISPFVEAVQFQMLFNEIPESSRRYESAKSILDRNSDKIKTLASIWNEFLSKKEFRADIYHAEFLDAYLAYYLTVNVGKLQLLFLDLLRQRLIPKRFALLDIGVASGTTFLAFLDFLVAWESACLLHNVEFPVESVDLHGVDARQECLDYSAKSTKAFAEILANTNATNLPLSKWVKHAAWVRCDLAKEDVQQPDCPTLLVCSNVLSEKSMEVTAHERIAGLIRELPEHSVVLLLEPGDQVRTRKLNGWRRQLLREDETLQLVGPCGMEHGHKIPSQCNTCWNGRRESLHRPLLYQYFCDAAEEKYNRWKEEYENNLLSWSYLCFTRSSQRSNYRTIQQKSVTRYIGRFKKFEEGKYEPLAEKEEVSIANEKIKFCPASLPEEYLAFTLEREKGKILPKLTFGQQLELEEMTNVNSQHSHSKEYRVQAKDVKLLNPPIKNRNFLPSYSEATRRGIDAIAYRLFGFPQMREFQHQILTRVLTGRSIFGIAATGGGKSECYILPALLLPGLTVVISPLKSLMQDQYDQRLCNRYGLDTLATYINSSVDFRERENRIRRMELGYYKIVYLTPEQFEQGGMLDSLRRAHEQVGFRYLALDEAHCISHWGHDFRPAYLNLLSRINRFDPQPLRIALTATASPQVQKDICEELGLDERPLNQGGDLLVYSANRPELNLIVKVVETVDEKVIDIQERLDKLLNDNKKNVEPGAAIVFMPHTGSKTVKPDNDKPYWKYRTVSGFASYLECQLKTRVGTYHGNIDDGSADDDDTEDLEKQPDGIENQQIPLGTIQNRTRRTEQNRFIKGKNAIMVATKGFGMGIDKPNIRLVLHHTTPGNLEAYTQEAGRAGRDGRLADVILYFTPQTIGDQINKQNDYEVQRYFLDNKYIREEDVRFMYGFLQQLLNEPDSRHPPNTRYFTADEVMCFFEKHQFTWPKFPQKHIRNYSDEHWEILFRGNEYKQKVEYIQRILAALHRIRIKQNNQYFGVLKSFQKQGSMLKDGSVSNPEQIIKSNASFGRLLRENKITVDQLKFYLEGDKKDLIPFAQKLGISLRETIQLAYDISKSDDTWIVNKYNKKERVSYLLNFTIFTRKPKRLDSLSAWRNYAGAIKHHINDNINNKKSLDYWFDWKGLPKSIGWEITPGEVLKNPKLLEWYLREFMVIHTDRKNEDDKSFELLVSDYIGVDNTGRKLSQNQSCLRAVMLGYLKTNETVMGGNCGGCSVCCPDERFERDLEKRKQLIVRLSEGLANSFTQLEQYDSDLPEEEELENFWKQIAEDEQSGHSITGYLQGWTNRLLSETPQHVAAHWIRANGSIKDLLPATEADLLNDLAALNIAGGQWLPRLKILYENAQPLINEEMARYWLIQAKLMSNLGQADKERAAWEEFLPLATKYRKRFKPELFECRIRLAALFAPTSPLANAESHRACLIAAIQTDPEKAADIVKPYVASWSFTRLTVMLSKAPPTSHETLIRAWFTNRNAEPLTILEAVLNNLASNKLTAKISNFNPLIFPFLLTHYESNKLKTDDIPRLNQIIDQLGQLSPSDNARFLCRSAMLCKLTGQQDSELGYWKRLLQLEEGNAPEQRSLAMSIEAYQRLAAIHAPDGFLPHGENHRQFLLEAIHLEPRKASSLIMPYLHGWSFEVLLEFLIQSDKSIYSGLIKAWFSRQQSLRGLELLNAVFDSLDNYQQFEQLSDITPLLSPYLLDCMERLTPDFADADQIVEAVSKLRNYTFGQQIRYLQTATKIMQELAKSAEVLDYLEEILALESNIAAGKRNTQSVIWCAQHLAELYTANQSFKDKPQFQACIANAIRLSPEHVLNLLEPFVSEYTIEELLECLISASESVQIQQIDNWFRTLNIKNPVVLINTVRNILYKDNSNLTATVKSAIVIALLKALQTQKIDFDESVQSVNLVEIQHSINNLSSFSTVVENPVHRNAVMKNLLHQAHRSNCAVKGLVTGRKKGGFDVDLAGIRAFLPKSHSANISERDFNKIFDFKIIEFDINHLPTNVVISYTQMKESLKIGQIFKGKVKVIQSYGAFVDCGFFEGLLHISNMGQNNTLSVHEILKVGQEIEVQLLDSNRDNNNKERYSLKLIKS